MWRLSKRPVQTVIRCSTCLKSIAVRVDETLIPSAPTLTAVGAASMRGVGWFCSRDCVSAYESRFRVILEPDSLSST
jgi:hypothetical protein